MGAAGTWAWGLLLVALYTIRSTAGAPELGACCKESGACSLLTESDCRIEGGAFHGAGTDCASRPCEVPFDRRVNWIWSRFSIETPIRVFRAPYGVAEVESARVGGGGIEVLAGDSVATTVRVDREGAATLARRGIYLYEILFVRPDSSDTTKLVPDSLPRTEDIPLLEHRAPAERVVYTEDFTGFQVPGAGWEAWDHDPGNGSTYWGNDPTWSSCAAPSAGYWQDYAGEHWNWSCNGFTSQMDARLDNSGIRNGAGIYIGYVTNPKVEVYYEADIGTEASFSIALCGDHGPCQQVYIPIGYHNAVATFQQLDPTWTRCSLYCVFVSANGGFGDGAHLRQVDVRGDVVSAPDLAVTSCQFQQNPTDPWKGTVQVTVQNRYWQAPAAAPACRVALLRHQLITWPNLVTPDLCTDFVEVPPLAPGAQFQTTIPISYEGGNLGSQDLQHESIHAIVDPDRWVCEGGDSSIECEYLQWNNICSQQALWVLPRPVVLLVPGVPGSELQKGSDTPWSGRLTDVARTLHDDPDRLRLWPDQTDYSGGSATATKMIDALSLTGARMYLPLLRNDYQAPYGVRMFPIELEVPPETDVWKSLKSHLTQTYGYTPGYDLLEVPWDWRKPLQQAATQALEPAVVTAGSRSRRVVVVSHSAGGLLTMAYARDRERRGLSPLIDAWITLGTPFQGGANSFAALAGMGESGSSWLLPRLNRRLADGLKRIVENSAGVYTMLPTGSNEGPIYGGTSPCTYPCVLEPTLTWDVSFDEFRLGDWPSNAPPNPRPPGWVWTPSVWQNYVVPFRSSNYTANVSIPKKWHLVSNTRTTLDKIVRYEMRNCPSGHSGARGDVIRYRPAFDLPGDGTVTAGSAEDTGQGGKLLYLDAAHRNLPIASGVPELVGRLAMGVETLPLPTTLSESSDAFPARGRMRAEFRMLYGKLIGSDLESVPVPTFPVSMEWIDMTDESVLQANVEFEQNGQPTGIFANHSFDPRLSTMTAADDLALQRECLWSDPPHRIRLILVPDPDFWHPTSVPTATGVPDGQQFEIGGQLVLRTDGQTYAFPPSESQSWIRFSRLRPGSGAPALGFSAFVEFTLEGCGIGETELTLYIDADGDGWIDQEVTGVSDAPSVGAPDPLRIEPNPFREHLTVAWQSRLSVGATLETFDAIGRRVDRRRLESGDTLAELDLRAKPNAGPAAGAYFFVLRDGTGEVLGRGKAIRLRE